MKTYLAWFICMIGAMLTIWVVITGIGINLSFNDKQNAGITAFTGISLLAIGARLLLIKKA